MGSDYMPPQPALLEHRMRRMKVHTRSSCVFLKGVCQAGVRLFTA